MSPVIFREVKCGSALGVPRVSARHSAALEHGENPRLDILSAGQHSRLDREGRKQRRDDEDDEYDGPRDELRYAAVQLGLSAAVLGG